MAAVLAWPGVKPLLSSEHSSVAGTLVEAWASLKCFKAKDTPGNRYGEGGGRHAAVDLKGQKRSNETHASTSDPDAMLYRKEPGMEAKLCFIGHGLMKNRSGLIVDARLSLVSGDAERMVALEMRSRPAPAGRSRSRWVPTADTTRRTSLQSCAS